MIIEVTYLQQQYRNQKNLSTSQQSWKFETGAKAWFGQQQRNTTQAPECITQAPQEPRSWVARCWPEVARKGQFVKARTITTPCLNLSCFCSFHLTRSIPDSWSQLFSKHCPSRLQRIQVHLQLASNSSNVYSIELVIASSLDDHEVLQAASELLKGRASLIFQVIA